MMAKDSQAITGHPKILPVRVAYTKNLPLRLSAAIGHLQHFEWRDAADNDVLLMTLLQAIGKSERSDAEPTSLLLRGDHFIVTKSMWQLDGGARVSGRHHDRARVEPVRRQRLAVTRDQGSGVLRVKVLDGGALEVAIWKGARLSARAEPSLGSSSACSKATLTAGASPATRLMRPSSEAPGRPQGSDCCHLRSGHRAGRLADHAPAGH